MALPRIADYIHLQRRFLRSAHLERDFRDPSALEGYVSTPQIQQSLDRIADGLHQKSGQRAWRITGDYGSGKSSFALLLAHVFANGGKDSVLPPALRKSLDLSKVRENRKRLYPVLITGSREPLSVAVSRSLLRALEEAFDGRSRVQLIETLRSVLATPKPQIADDAALRYIQEANSELIARDKADGLLIILDELGKFLEFAALHPERQDIFFLQQLAEAATRSSREPLFTVGLLHQGFNAYADQLSQVAQKEWEKVAGRFEELLFDQPLHQVTQLIASALNLSGCPRGADARAKDAMRSAANLGWFGAAPPTNSLIGVAAWVYPLHPTVIPVLVKLFSRFGQNERSLFSFLLSNEPHGLQSFVQQAPSADAFYRIHNLYDYAAASFGYRLSVQSYRNHWNHIDSLIRSFPDQNDANLAILKTVGLLNLLNSAELTPTEDAIVLATSSDSSQGGIRAAIQWLHRERHVLYSRGKNGGYCLWSHTSVNLDAAYEVARRGVGSHRKVTAHIKENLDTRPIVARRHYIKTGNLRHFDVVYCSATELPSLAPSRPANADGRILIPLCETQEEVQFATEFAQSFKDRPDTLIGITAPLASLAGLLLEVERWVWVQKNVPELKDDRYAAEEVTRQLTAARHTLEKQIQHYAALRQASPNGDMPIRWYSEGQLRNIRSSTEFLSFISDIADRLFDKAPVIHNELVNRRSLSSAAASARMRLIEHMFASGDKEYLGMDPEKKPPEMSIYLSVLQRSGLHANRNNEWTIGEPLAESDSCNLLPALSRIRELLEQQPDTRVAVTHVLEVLRNPPYGIRDGVLHLFLLVVLLQHQHEIAVYENGTFLSELGSEVILRLTKKPQTFELQFCRIQGIRRTLFDKLLQVLGLQSKPKAQADILDIVRPLCVFVSELPEYTRVTRRLSLEARAVRDAILDAREPATLLFKNLPEAVGLEPVGPQIAAKISPERTQEFVVKLRAAIEELKMTYPLLRDRIRERIALAFDGSKSSASLQNLRNSLSERCEPLVVTIRDMDLKAFCFRLLDNQLPEPDWIESIASYVANNPPLRWKDDDETTFQEKLGPLVQKFLRVESVNYVQGAKPSTRASFRVALTARDGTERDRVIFLTSEEETEVKALEESISRLHGSKDSISIMAIARVLWRLLGNDDGKSN